MALVVVDQADQPTPCSLKTMMHNMRMKCFLLSTKTMMHTLGTHEIIMLIVCQVLRSAL